MADDQAVLVYLNGTDLPDPVYADYDLAILEDQLIERIVKDRLGEFDGNEFGPAETVLYMYGPDAAGYLPASNPCFAPIRYAKRPVL